jgi:hypothetical protein
MSELMAQYAGDVTASLEEAYFRLTGESVEYRAAAQVAS